MIRALLSFLIVLSVFQLNGQAVSVEPSTTTATVDAADTDIAAKAIVKNTSDKTKEFYWIRSVNEISQGWETAVCDKNLCYNPSVDSMTLTLGPGEESNLDVHVYPNGIEGSANVSVSIVEVSSPENTASAEFLFNQTTAIQAFSNTEISIYPNPSTDFFQLSSKELVAKIELFNLLGDKMKTYYAYKNKRYPVSGLPHGMYLARLLDVDNKVVKTLRLNIR